MRLSNVVKIIGAGLVVLAVSECGVARNVARQSDRIGAAPAAGLAYGLAKSQLSGEEKYVLAAGVLAYGLVESRSNGAECDIIAATLSHKPLGLSLRRLRTDVKKRGGPLMSLKFPSLTDEEQNDLDEAKLRKQSNSFSIKCNWQKLGFKDAPAMTYGSSYSFIGRPVISAKGDLAVVGVGKVSLERPRALALDPAPNPVVGEGQFCLLRRLTKGWVVETCRSTWAL
jgi:hypothetical protein